MMWSGSPLAMSCADAHAPPLRSGERSAPLRVGGVIPADARAGVFLGDRLDARRVRRALCAKRTEETRLSSVTEPTALPTSRHPRANPIDGRFLAPVSSPTRRTP